MPPCTLHKIGASTRGLAAYPLCAWPLHGVAANTNSLQSYVCTRKKIEGRESKTKQNKKQEAVFYKLRISKVEDVSCHHACCTDSYTYTSSHQPKVQEMCSRSGHQSSFGFMAHPKQVLRSSCWQGMHALSCFSLPSTDRCLVDAIYCHSSSHVQPLKPSNCTYHIVGACNICAACTHYTHAYSFSQCNGGQMRCYGWMNHQGGTSTELATLTDVAL